MSNDCDKNWACPRKFSAYATDYAYTKKNVSCSKKATFHYKGKLQERFRSGLNEMKLATTTQITNSSLLFKRVAATEVTALCIKQTTLMDSIGQWRF